MNTCAHARKSERKEERSMNRIWADALVAVLVAATESLIQVVKRLKKKKGKAVL